LPAWPALETLLLGHNEVADWAAVDQLDLFPALRDVRLTGNPVLRTEAGGGRFQVPFQKHTPDRKPFHC
jgi:hypothetical protein